MKGSTRIRLWLGAAAIVAAAYFLFRPESGTLTLDEAVQTGSVDVEILAGDSNAGSVTITLTRRADDSNAYVVTIPAGELLQASDGAGQRLMTSRTATIVVDDAEPSASQTITTLCIDPFKAPPLANATLALAAPAGGAAMEETDPIRKLVGCMSDSEMTDSARQTAVWAVAAQLLRKTPEDARAYVSKGLEQEMIGERREQLEAKRERAREMAASLSEAQLDALIDRELQNSMPTIRQVAAQQSAGLLDALRQGDGSVLAACGYAVAEMAVFQ